MIKVEVVEKFTLEDFHKLKNITRKSVDEKGKLFVGDTFECDEAMMKYLTGENKLKRPFVKVIEVKPEEAKKVVIKEVAVEVPREENTSYKVDLKKSKKKKTSKK